MNKIDSDFGQLVKKCAPGTVIETISTMTGLSLDLGSDPGDDCQFAGAMFVSGDEKMLLVLKTRTEYALTLVSYMTGADPSDIPENELYDGVGEIVNMVAGLIKARLASEGYSVTLTIPFSMVGEKMRVVTSTYVERFSFDFFSELLKLKLELYFI